MDNAASMLMWRSERSRRISSEPASG
uniref:Uncharacterized protein n=1 Tax=Anopheles minimus TaxID=112268 RepID=A0A182WPM7_9DIPT